MRKDIIIPTVENVYIAAMQEWNDDFMEKTWFAYLINDGTEKLETVIVVSGASGTLNGEERKTSSLRHAFAEVMPNTAVKIEMIENSVLALNNNFMVTFFIGNTLYDKNYMFTAGTISEDNTKELPVIYKAGVFAQ